MSTASFKLYFCGPDLENGQMDVKELAPALLAVGDLLEESNRVLNGNKAVVQVKVKKFEDGSFGVDFQVVQQLLDQVVAMFTGDDIEAALNIIECIGLASGSMVGLFKLLKWAKGRKPQKVKELQSGNIELDFSENSIEISPQVFKLFKDINVRSEVENILKPLEMDGISSIAIKQDDEVVETIDKEEKPYFETPELEDEKIHESETTAYYSILSLSFKEDNKWRLSDGTSPIYATILDEVFLSEIDKNQRVFSKGDRLKARVRIKAFETSAGLRTEYEVLEVLKHETPFRQINLPCEWVKQYIS